MKYLGIDYGKTKIGLAVSDGEIATAWKVITISGLDDALRKILIVVEKEKIDCVVIGKAESGESLKIADSFVKKFKEVSIVKIVEVKETLSTQGAKDAMLALGLPKKKRTEDDSYAAQIILQDFLDQNNLS